MFSVTVTLLHNSVSREEENPGIYIINRFLTELVENLAFKRSILAILYKILLLNLVILIIRSKFPVASPQKGFTRLNFPICNTYTIPWEAKQLPDRTDKFILKNRCCC